MLRLTRTSRLRKGEALRSYLLTIGIPLQDSARAHALQNSLDPDNEGYVESSISEGVLTFVLRSGDAGSLRQSADDLLTCLKVADEVSGIL